MKHIGKLFLLSLIVLLSFVGGCSSKDDIDTIRLAEVTRSIFLCASVCCHI